MYVLNEWNFYFEMKSDDLENASLKLNIENLFSQGTKHDIIILQ